MKYVIGVLIFILFLSCGSVDPQQENTSPPSHEAFDKILKKYVNEAGMVDYEGLLVSRSELDSYYQTLIRSAPNDVNWSKKDQLAYWINLYNAATLVLVLDHYPVESIKDIGSKIQIPFVNTPWDIKFIEINEEKYDLNNIEHGIIRKKFDEPRIHFAVNCASFSCPKLRPEAYTGLKLEEQLEEQTIDFINDPERNRITKEEVLLSKIFFWYGGDFTNGQTKIEFINRYLEKPVDEDVDIEYLDYDWTLNTAN